MIENGWVTSIAAYLAAGRTNSADGMSTYTQAEKTPQTANAGVSGAYLNDRQWREWERKHGLPDVPAFLRRQAG